MLSNGSVLVAKLCHEHVKHGKGLHVSYKLASHDMYIVLYDDTNTEQFIGECYIRHDVIHGELHNLFYYVHKLYYTNIESVPGIWYHSYTSIICRSHHL